jgi:hypothetical protein
MKNITKSGTSAANLDSQAEQPRPIILALMFTGILYFSVTPKLPNNRAVNVASPQITTNLSASVVNAVLQDAAERWGVPKSDFRIVRAQQLNWPDLCLGLDSSANSVSSCPKRIVPGWHLTIARGDDQWSYRTNASGSEVALENSNSSPKRSSNNVAIATTVN